MDDNKKKQWIKRGVTLVLDLVLAGVITYWRIANPPYEMTETPIFFALSDGFFIVGFLNFAFGALLWISTTGVLDIISYGFKSVLYLFTSRRKEKDEGGYYEYKMRKKEKRKAVPFETLWIGGGMIILSIIFNYLLYV